MARYHATKPTPTSGAVVTDTLEAVAREGARRMLALALEAEVHVFLGRDRLDLPTVGSEVLDQGDGRCRGRRAQLLGHKAVQDRHEPP